MYYILCFYNKVRYSKENVIKKIKENIFTVFIFKNLHISEPAELKSVFVQWSPVRLCVCVCNHKGICS